MRGAAAALLLLLAPPVAVSAQEPYLNLFLYEKSYAAVGTPRVIGAPSYYAAVAEPSLLAEAQFVDHIVLHRGLNAQELREGKGGAGWNWYITPQFRLRALDIPSGPIRSPSFMPKFTIQWLRSTGGKADEPTAGMRWVTAAHFVIGHHSNGGATCEFVDEDPQADCAVRTPPAPPPGQREVWVEGGNFSTNYVEVGGYFRRGRLSDEPHDSHWAWALDFGAMYQYHQDVIGFPLPGGAKDDFAALYGRNRFRIDVAGHRVFANAFAVRGWARTDLFHVRAERFPGARHYTLTSEILVQRVEGMSEPSWLDKIPTYVGLGVRWVRGEDYYNTQYVRDINLVQFFLTVDPWSPWAGN